MPSGVSHRGAVINAALVRIVREDIYSATGTSGPRCRVCSADRRRSEFVIPSGHVVDTLPRITVNRVSTNTVGVRTLPVFTDCALDAHPIAVVVCNRVRRPIGPADRVPGCPIVDEHAVSYVRQGIPC